MSLEMFFYKFQDKDIKRSFVPMGLFHMVPVTCLTSTRRIFIALYQGLNKGITGGSQGVEPCNYVVNHHQFGPYFAANTGAFSIEII